MTKINWFCNKATSVSDPDPFGYPFHFVQPDPEPGSKKSAKIIRISYIFFKTIKLMFTDINIYSINNKTDHISEKYIFYIDGFGAGSIISPNGSEDPDPYQNETDPKH